MTEIVSPFAQFFDTNGAPLNNGAIFIGTAYLDAQTNPIPVYWDEALTIPAAQPIRTLNGYAVWNGAPARIFCNEFNFSMTVKTSTGRTVWTASNTNTISLREIVSVKDFGAVGNGIADDSAAFQAAGNAAREVFIPAGTYLANSVPAYSNNVTFTFDAGASLSGNLANAIGGGGNTSSLTLQSKTTGADFATSAVRRNAFHSGGTPGFVSSAFRADSYVGAGATNYEWAILGRVYNEATAGENVGVYAQGIKAASGATWGGVAEARNITNSANDTAGLIGLEVDVFANGADTNNNRIGIDIVVGQGVTGAGNQACQAYAGLRVDARNSTGDAGSFSNGIVVNSGTFSGISLRHTGTIGISFQSVASVVVGIDFSAATFGQSAMRLARGQKVDWENTGTINQALDAAVNVLRFNFGTTERVGFNLSSVPADNAIRINSNPVVGPRKTGWAAATGTADRTSFDTSTVTTTALAQRVKALLDDLISHGLIGA